jgi:hypothetical protein
MSVACATAALIQTGLRAWAAGDLDALERLFDPGVTLRGPRRASGTAPAASR